jgi:hypothetical protein
MHCLGFRVQGLVGHLDQHMPAIRWVEVEYQDVASCKILVNDPLRSLGFMMRTSGSRLKVDAMVHVPGLLKWSLGLRDLRLGSRIFGVQGLPACAASPSLGNPVPNPKP